MQGTLDEIGRVTFIDWSSGLWHPHTFTLQNRTALEAIQRMRTSNDPRCALLLAHAMIVVVSKFMASRPSEKQLSSSNFA